MLKQTFDKAMVLKAANKLAATEGKIGRDHVQIIKDLLAVMAEVEHPSRVGILEEAAKDFKAEDRKPGGSRASEYQYVSRMKAIVGAAFLVKGFDPLTFTGINPMYTASRKALDEEKLNWKGEDIAAKKAKEEADALAKLRSEVEHKLAANAPEGQTMAEFRAAVEAEVSAIQAGAMLEDCAEKAEKYAIKMIEQQGAEYALRFADVMLATVRAVTQ